LRRWISYSLLLAHASYRTKNRGQSPISIFRRGRAGPDVTEQLQRQGYFPEGSTPEGLAAINREDLALRQKLVREAGIALE
jgi:hypothetical protein